MEQFYAYLDRMKFIKRWQLMRSVRDENIMEHSHSVAVLTHALVCIENGVFGGHIDAEKAVFYALYHEVSEVMTGDLPTPVKYFNNSIHGEYEKLEKLAVEKIADTLPPELKKELYPYLQAEKHSDEYRFVKAADKLSAYIKCLEELRSGNREFARAALGQPRVRPGGAHAARIARTHGAPRRYLLFRAFHPRLLALFGRARRPLSGFPAPKPNKKAPCCFTESFS